MEQVPQTWISTIEIDLLSQGVDDSDIFAMVNSNQFNFNISALKLSNIWSIDKKITKIGLAELSKFIVERQLIATLDISFNSLNDEDLAILCSCFIHLQKLYLGGNSISYYGTCMLIKPVLVGKCLTILDLSKNELGDLGAMAISEFLYGNQVLKKLYLSSNCISSVGLSQLSLSLIYNCSLICFDLQRNNIDSKGLMFLIGRLFSNSCLKCLLLNGNRLTDDCMNSVIKLRKYSQITIGIYDNRISASKNQKLQLISNSLK